MKRTFNTYVETPDESPVTSLPWYNNSTIPGRAVEGARGAIAPQYFALSCLEGPLMGKKGSLGEKFEDLLGGKASTAKKIKDFQRKKPPSRNFQ